MEAVAFDKLADARHAGSLRSPAGACPPGRHIADRYGNRRVPVVALDDRPAVDRDDVAFFEDVGPGIPWTMTLLGDAQMTAGNPW